MSVHRALRLRAALAGTALAATLGVCVLHGPSALAQTAPASAVAARVVPAAAITVTVKFLTGATERVTTTTSTTVLGLKEQVFDLGGVGPQLQRLIFAGKEMQDARTLGSYNVTDGSVINDVVRL
ncbi:ubiquitin domain-containing protein [Kitasatospora sp. SolWspMP-SS2h]|uniref:ubiquitin family protein n=1 Tax=Kitasatospora sp. SolWspMP-SS2h TaxID=1305729 RepID=UPI000DC048D8|nr:ubiquitin family protein [Kitasatospora sp. SolWspMP-SS2h]RAJ31278.1 ubiquitin domain-containing protein [Kitasatospora sp. SolWspMP-SS2h]